MKTYDVVVIGAGGMGAATAYHLAGDGRRVLLLEQFQVGHKQGSSHGGSRIIRHSHAEPAYASLAPAAFAYWRALETESGVPLLAETGSLDFGPPEFPALAGRIATMTALGYPHRVLDREALARSYPQFRFAEDWVALYQPGAGILSASKAVATLIAQAVRRGATLQEQSRVVAVTPSGEGVAIEVASPRGREMLQTGQVVLTAGPWAGTFLHSLGITDRMNLPLRVTHQQVVYFEVEPGAGERWSPSACPVYICLPMPHFYGFPIWERPGQIKIGLELDGEGVDPDTHPRQVLQAPVAELCDLVAEHLAGVSPRAVSAEACLYTHSPDGDFIVDRHPDHPQILIGAGFSGRGFKFTILIGRLLADLAACEPGTYRSSLWREIFRIDRFAATPVDSDHTALKL